MSKKSIFSDELKKFMPDEGTLIGVTDHSQNEHELGSNNDATEALEKVLNVPFVQEADIDGDGDKEIVGAYKIKDVSFIIIIKLIENQYVKIADFEGDYDELSYLNVAPIKTSNKDDLILGYKEDNCNKLSILDFSSDGTIHDLVDHDLYFDDIDLGNLTCYRTEQEKAKPSEIALWRKTTNGKEQLSVYRYNKGKLVLALDAYDHYRDKRQASRIVQKQDRQSSDQLDTLDLLGHKPNKSKTSNKETKDLFCTSVEEISKMKESIQSKETRKPNLYPAREKTKQGIKWGYINKEGVFEIKPQYETAFDFDESKLAVVQDERNWGAINKDGSFVIEPKHQGLSHFKEDRAVAIDRDGFKLIDLEGTVLTNRTYDYMNLPEDGRVLVSVREQENTFKYGYLDLQGKEVIPPRYEMASDFQNGKAIVRDTNNVFALINKNGERLNEYRGYYVGDLNDDRLVYQPDQNASFGYLNEAGDEVIEPQYQAGFPFVDGVAIVAIKEGERRYLGVIDKKGNYVIKPEYNDLFPLFENRIAVGKARDPKRPYLGSFYAIATTSGERLTDFNYSNIMPFENGYASVYDDNKTYFITKQGKKASNLPEVLGAGYLTFMNGLIRADIDNRMMYLNRKGDIVWEQKSTIDISENVRIKEEKFKHSKDHIVYYPQFIGIDEKAVLNNINERLKKLSVVKRSTNEFEEYDYNYYSDYSVISVNNDLVELEFNSYNKVNGKRRGVPFRYNAHVDIETGAFYELSDLFKPNSDYIGRISRVIKEQIELNGERLGINKQAYKGIDFNQPFYINDSDLYIYFYIYSIAPKEAGYPTFSIPLDELDDIIDHKGDFYAALKGYRIL